MDDLTLIELSRLQREGWTRFNLRRSAEYRGEAFLTLWLTSGDNPEHDRSGQPDPIDEYPR
jgi:hypothetical protein